jgi:ElaB/YqjD/DUF883 family membrane-anchored ribosome-binding protein
MDKESDVIKHQMEHTRAALTDKLELLEHQVTDTVTEAADTVEKVRHTVQDTVSEATQTVEKVRQTFQDTVSGAAEKVASMKHAVRDTVESVRESVRETAAAVSETLDIRKQVEKHPWAMMVGATAVGFGVGVLVSRVDVQEAASGAASSIASSAKSLASSGSGAAGDHSPGWTGPQREQRAVRQQPGWQEEESPWMPAVNKLKGLAIGTMFGVLRDVLSKSMPDTLRGQVGEVIDDFTTSFGGKPIAGKVLPDSWSGERREHEETMESRENWQATNRDGQGGSPRPRQTAMADIEE